MKKKTKKIEMSKRKKKRKVTVLQESIADLLTEKQKLFCELYSFDKICFGNASAAYRTAYMLSPKQYLDGRVSAHQTLTNPNIKAYIASLMEDRLVDNSVDRELSKMIHQDKDTISKIAAINAYNKLKQRIVDKVESTLVLPAPIYGGKSARTAKV